MTRTQIAALALSTFLAAGGSIDDAVIETAIESGYDLDDDGEIDEVAAIVRDMIADRA